MPAHHTKAAIVSVGDELTLGQTLDTNSKWLSEMLAAAGIVTVERVTVPDDAPAQAAAFRRLGGACDVLVCTGGLGPTADDLTRRALSEAMGDGLVEDSLSLAQIEAYFSGRGREMPALNRVQAMRPSRAASIPNALGTAPGLQGTIETRGRSCDVFCLPGPPGEMRPMFERHVLPRLRPEPGRTVRTRSLHCFGIGESDLATRLGELMDRSRMPLVGTTASGGVVSCRLRYEGSLAPVDAEVLLDQTEAAVRRLAGAYLFSDASPNLAEAVLELLKKRGETLGVVESCTGGLLGAMITEISGSSAVFLGGLVTYANAAKSALADVPEPMLGPAGPGAVSAEVATAMAVGGLARLNIDHCLAITGIAGPDGGTPKKPVGTVFIAAASRARVDCREFRMSGDRASIRDWSAKSALAMLRLDLIGASHLTLLRQVM